MRGTLLLVGDDHEYLAKLELHFRTCRIACNVSALDSAKPTAAAAVSLDAALIDLDAVPDPLPLLRSYRQAIGAGVLLACADQFTTVDVVQAYGAGVDDYFAKSTDIVVVEAKVRRAIRHSKYRDLEPERPNPSATSTFRDLVRLADAKLTRYELRLLQLLADTPEQLVSKRVILEQLWGRSSSAPNLLYEHISTLRSKLVPIGWTIFNVRGKGYRLEPVCAESVMQGAERNSQVRNIPFAPIDEKHFRTH